MCTFVVLVALSASVMAGVPGGVNDVDVNDPQHMERIWTGLATINAASNSPNYLVPVKVVNATKQVVSGMKYTWDVVVAETDCNKANGNLDRATCLPSANAPTSTYRLTLWEQPWNNVAQYSAEKIN